MSIPVSQFISPPTYALVTISVFSTSVTLLLLPRTISVKATEYPIQGPELRKNSK